MMASRTAVVMTDMDGWEIVIDCDRAEAQVVFDEPEDAGILARLARKRTCKLCEYCNVSGRIAGLCGCME